MDSIFEDPKCQNQDCDLIVMVDRPYYLRHHPIKSTVYLRVKSQVECTRIEVQFESVEKVQFSTYDTQIGKPVMRKQEAKHKLLDETRTVLDTPSQLQPGFYAGST